MENILWMAVITRSAFLRDPETQVRELVSQWSTSHRAKVYGVSIDYKTTKKLFGLVKTVTATITYSRIGRSPHSEIPLERQLKP